MKTKTALAILFLAMSVMPAWALDAECSNIEPCTFSWTANTEPDIKEYKLYLRGLLGMYDRTTPALVIPHPATEAVSENLPLTPGEYGVVVTASDLTGNESMNSNELTIRYMIIDVEAPTPPVISVTTVPVE